MKNYKNITQICHSGLSGITKLNCKINLFFKSGLVFMARSRNKCGMTSGGIFTALLAFLVVQLLDPNLVLAAAGTDVGDNDVLKGFAQLLSVFVNLFTFLALLLLNYGGDLLGTEFLTASTPMEAIRPMWVIIRNLTNVGFVLVLLFLAFSNLFNFGDGGNWTIKEKLPKIIFALIAVNFSLLGFRVLIDAVHVGTITLLSIPQTALETKGSDSVEKLLKQGINGKGMRCGVSEETQNGADEDPREDPRNGEASCQYFYTRVNYLLCKDSFNADGSPSSKDVLSQSDCLFKIELENLGNSNAKSMTASNLFLAFGVFFQKLEQLPALAAELDSWTGVITNVLFSGILAMAYVVSLVAVFIALLFRMVVLWLAMVFSPLLVAAGIMGFGDKGGDLGGKVVTNLIMPLKIAAAFAVSFIMISAMIDVIPQNSANFFKFGPALNQFSNNGYGLLWQITTVIVFWTAAFWAVKGSEGETIINHVKGAAEKAGGFVARAATIDRPIFTMPGKDGGERVKASMAGMLSMPMATVDKGISQQKEDRDKFLASMGLMDDGAVEAGKELRELAKKIKDTTGKADKVGVLDTHLRDYGGTRNAFKDPKSLTAAINELNINDERQKEKLIASIGKDNEFILTWKDIARKNNISGLDEVNYKTGIKKENSEKKNENTIPENQQNESLQIGNSDNSKYLITYKKEAVSGGENITDKKLLKEFLSAKVGIASVELKGLDDTGLKNLATELKKDGLSKADNKIIVEALKVIQGEGKPAPESKAEGDKKIEAPLPTEKPADKK